MSWFPMIMKFSDVNNFLKSSAIYMEVTFEMLHIDDILAKQCIFL